MNEAVLCTLYDIASRQPGWLSKLQKICTFTSGDLSFLEWLDDQEVQMNRKVRAFEFQMRREGIDVIDGDDDNERLEKLNKLLFTIEDQYQDLTASDKTYVEKSLFLLNQRYEFWKKLRNKIRARMIHTQYPDSMEITEQEIVRARSVPLEKLLGLDKPKHIVCPFHADKKPSFFVKDFGWCFTCGAWADSIKYLLEIEKMKFVDAVKRLCAMS